MKVDKIVSTVKEGIKLLDLGPNGRSPNDPELNTTAPSAPAALVMTSVATTSDTNKEAKEGPKPSAVATVAVKDHPKYSKYFRMLKVGLPRENVKAKMAQDGVSVDYLELDGNALVPIDELFVNSSSSSPQKHDSSSSSGANGGTGGSGGSGGGGSDENAKEDKSKVKISEHVTYQKYFKMLKLGLSVETIKHKVLSFHLPGRLVILSIVCS